MLLAYGSVAVTFYAILILNSQVFGKKPFEAAPSLTTATLAKLIVRQYNFKCSSLSELPADLVVPKLQIMKYTYCQCYRIFSQSSSTWQKQMA